ncbi:protein NnrT [Thioclava sp. DLFJ4-1]|uniref:protein NnrT n=1 Tax=Thioclava sp. DLFJ4-1 TaxID=1915313 RepID=UPI0009986539|nr:protein NnrT [Thioclava sp. DLFJ4-1]OOY14352.1 protein NnrT [Thioclava sp. DLFJ4-1]
MRKLTLLLALAPLTAQAASFDRPIPQAQSATAEFWFALATLALIAALAVVARVVARR